MPECPDCGIDHSKRRGARCDSCLMTAKREADRKHREKKRAERIALGDAYEQPESRSLSAKQNRQHEKTLAMITEIPALRQWGYYA